MSAEDRAQTRVADILNETLGHCTADQSIATHEARAMLVRRIVTELGPIMREVAEADLRAAWTPAHEVRAAVQEARIEGVVQITHDLRVCLDAACRLTSIDLMSVLAIIAVEEVHGIQVLKEMRAERESGAAEVPRAR